MRKARRQSPQNRWMRDPVKEKYWRKQLVLWQESGLSVRLFCKEHGIVETSFYAWRRELIIRARESNPEEAAELEETPNTLKDARGRNVSIKFRSTEEFRSLPVTPPPVSDENPFVPLSIVPNSNPKPQVQTAAITTITITTPSGFKISISELHDLLLLENILKTLEKIVC